MNKLLILSFTALTACTPLPAKELIVLRDCPKNGGVAEEHVNPLNPFHPVSFTCVKDEAVK